MNGLTTHGANGSGGPQGSGADKTLVMEGRLSDFTLPSILQVVSIGRQLTSIELADRQDSTIGSISIKSGQIVNARLRHRGGVDAFYDLFTVPLDHFRVYRLPTPDNLPDPIGAVGPLVVKAMEQQPKRISRRPRSFSPRPPRISEPVAAPPVMEPSLVSGKPKQSAFGDGETSAGATKAATHEPAQGKRPSTSPGSGFPAGPAAPSKAPHASVYPASSPAAEASASDMPAAPPATKQPTATERQTFGLAPKAAPSSSIPAPSRSPERDALPPSMQPFPPATLGNASGRPRILAFVSPKGGVGKTTIALNVAVSIARQGRRVIVVDADLNGDIMSSVAARDRVHVGAHELLETKQLPEDALIQTVIPELRLLPSCGPDLPYTAFEPKDRRAQWKRLLGLCAQKAEVVIVDTPAGMFDVTKELLGGCTHVVGIVQCEVIARRSFVPNFLRGLDLLGPSRPEVAGVLLNMFQRDQTPSVSVVQDIASGLPAEWLLDTTIPRTPVFLEAADAGVPIRLLDEKCPPSVAWLFDMLASEITQRLKLQQQKVSRAAFLT